MFEVKRINVSQTYQLESPDCGSSVSHRSGELPIQTALGGRLAIPHYQWHRSCHFACAGGLIRVGIIQFLFLSGFVLVYVAILGVLTGRALGHLGRDGSKIRVASPLPARELSRKATRQLEAVNDRSAQLVP